jgi:putative addiction module killer protein
MQPKYRIEEYVASDGTAHFSRWLSRLSDLRAKAKILIRIKRAESGNVGQHRSVGGGVMEMIVDTGPGYRVYFATAGREALVLLAGGSKRSQRRDIILARERWSDFRSRSNFAEPGS